MGVVDENLNNFQDGLETSPLIAEEIVRTKLRELGGMSITPEQPSRQIYKDGMDES